ncbi:MAG: permease-like cell division protein FtsX [Eubacterium sp.]|nr:permease-like cell division protein FtsX [Eubacterium sp.]
MSRIFYNIKQALIQIVRYRTTTLASLFAITAMMLILGLFFTLAVNLNLFTEMIKRDYDTVEVFLEDDVSEDDAKAIMNEVTGITGVSEVEYRSKAEALQIMKDRWGSSGYLLDSLGGNPLPNSILVTVTSLDAADAVNSQVSTIQGVESTRYYKETVDKLTKVTNFLQYGSLAIMMFLVLISIIVVSNMIKLTVFARAREISIMKYIGATNWFIRGPFLVEGIIIGMLSALAAGGIIYIVYSNAVEVIGMKVMTILSSPLVPAEYLMQNLLIIFLALGVGIGSTGSIISMRKFLEA